MGKDKSKTGEKFAVNSKFHHDTKENKLPLPSLEDIRDSKKTESFSVSKKDVNI